MRGIDVSHYDGWPYADCTEEAYKDSDFVIVKATQGIHYIWTTFFTLAAERAIADGKLVGAYHYAAGGNPEAEAAYFVSVCRPYLGQIVLALDWEEGQNKSWGDGDWCKKFIDAVRKETGLTCILYTGMDGTRMCADLANKVPLWFAGYPTDRNTWAIPKWPSHYTTEPWDAYTIWQYTSGGDKVDRNTTQMRREDWEELASAEKAGEGYPLTFPKLPKRGYYRPGDGMTVLSGKRKQIKRVQMLVNWILGGAYLDVDGKYGPKTAAAVAKAQSVLGVIPDGLFGEITLNSARNYTK